MANNNQKSGGGSAFFAIIVIILVLGLIGSCSSGGSSSSSDTKTATCQSCGKTYRQGSSNYKKIIYSNLCESCYNHMKNYYEQPIN